ncbi:hypothetical protein SAMN05216338_101736 [Bradyrhizobium sp. Rc2d]|nr:hypothetical protein SAMN05216338_101736 [Bradyrhizobium sp. Rc2d]
MASPVRKAVTGGREALSASLPGMELSDFASESVTRWLYITVDRITFG